MNGGEPNELHHTGRPAGMRARLAVKNLRRRFISHAARALGDTVHGHIDRAGEVSALKSAD